MCIRVSSFLYCIGLETGIQIIGVLHLISALVMMILCAYWAKSFEEYLPTIENEDGVYTYWYRASVVISVLSSAHIMLAAMLLIGVHKKRPMLLLVWVLTMSALSLGSLLWQVISLFRNGPTSPFSGDRVLSFCEVCLFYGMMVYFMICVSSYYGFLKDDKQRDADAAAGRGVEDAELTKPL